MDNQIMNLAAKIPVMLLGVRAKRFQPLRAQLNQPM